MQHLYIHEETLELATLPINRGGFHYLGKFSKSQIRKIKAMIENDEGQNVGYYKRRIGTAIYAENWQLSKI